MSILLESGQRGLLVGQTGSGKSQNAMWQLRNSPHFPIIIFDTKIEPEFFGLPQGEEKIVVIESFEELEKLSKKLRREMPEYILVRPAIDEVTNFEILDAYCRLVFAKFGRCMIYFDELYSWHDRGRPTNGMVGLYTRGRSKGKTVLGATQRPSWISRFCMTESQKFYVHLLIDGRDEKSLAEVVPGISGTRQIPKYHFLFHEIGVTEKPQLFLPVPLLEARPEQIFKKTWI